MQIFRTRMYTRKISKLLDDEEIFAAERDIVITPEAWPIVPGAGGVRKARAARGNSGKSGGVRIIYYFWSSQKHLYFMDVYPKNKKENLTQSEKNILKSLVKEMIQGD